MRWAPPPASLRCACGADVADPQQHLADQVAAAVWPHLYAAALRHAAEGIERRFAIDPGMRGCDAATGLRRLADEVEAS